MSLSHDDLVKRAVKWLKQPYGGRLPNGDRFYKSGCGVVVPELVSYATEQPDAIGWYGGHGCIVVECKTSRADFLADQKKLHRNIGCAGDQRYYLCPPDLISPDELPDDWGLLYCHPNKITIQAEAKGNPNRSMHAEVSMMYSLLRRVTVRGLLKRCLAPKWGGDGPTSVVKPQPEGDGKE